jgi:hypothetical protein
MHTKFFFTVTLLLFIHAPTALYAAEPVNLLGEWKYILQIKNLGCDDKQAKGLITFNPSDDDPAVLGKVRIAGDTIQSEQGKCAVVPFSTILGRFTGTPSHQTQQQFEQSKVNDWNREYVKKAYLETYSNHKIVEVIEYQNNMVVKWVMTR